MVRLFTLLILLHGPVIAEDRIDAIGDALRFLAACQSPDGRWDVDGYHLHDPSGMVEPGKGGDDADVAVTAAVLLAFYGAGRDHQRGGPQDQAVARGLAWLVARQRADGSFPGSLSDHCLGAMLLCEAMGLTQDAALREPASRAVSVILAQQVKGSDGRPSGWGRPASALVDTRTTAYAVMALCSARGAGLGIGDAFAGARTWLLRAWRLANPDANAPAAFPATIDLSTGRVAGSAPEAGLVCASLLGAGNGSRIAHGLARTCVKRWPTIDVAVTDIEAAWFATHGIFLADGVCWGQWQAGGRAALRKAQCRGPASLLGSWNPSGQSFPDHERGRLLCTALATLANEVFMSYVNYEHDAPVREAFPEALHPGHAP